MKAILERLDDIEAADLTVANMTDMPEEQGVYALYLKDPQRLVYIGKTDSEAGLKHRLTRHARKLIGRKNITAADVQFKAIRLYVFTAMDLEYALIQYHGGVSQVAWNNSGFGSNDPGKERDTTSYKPDHWDTQYPIDLDHVFVQFDPGDYSVDEVMGRLKTELPFLLRYQRPGRSRNSFHEDFERAKVTVAHRGATTRELLQLCMRALPHGWHATALPSHIIAYKDDRRRFPSGEEIARS
ncbi:GIY-YIG nuclease family protein [Aliishimia ponticola]|uniref:GIY-YIG nuclease family protein n=1 Tax=Aliishimia ponticola TaxID=2499833 RepID=A0A4S4NAL6_9RHOB|nr:GIY-YIG nuclease family protein [Aliishimia ponticola]THH35715.1 GIY-YIG nuclease family protein [Aliishimia ponticola]